MGEDLLALADRQWQGEISHREWNRALEGGRCAELGSDTLFVASRGIVGNVTALRTREGLVLVDTGSEQAAEAMRARLRSWSSDRVHTIVYTHGHLDHVAGAPLYDREAEEGGRDRPRVVAHRNLPLRFDRYRRTAGWNTHINQSQFHRIRGGIVAAAWPTDYRYPDQTYDERLELEVGGLRLDLRHGRGETDDHSWIWIPSRRLLITGDFVIWAAPNTGNPQKVQRFTDGWSRALALMQGLGAETLIPGHGPPILGARRIETLLRETRRFLDSIEEQTVALMNEGLPLNTILHRVTAPEGLLDRPFLRPTYDDPEFLVRNIWRLYGGWHDGNPAHLKPALEAELAAEISTLAGGAHRLEARASELASEGKLRLAGHLIELAVQSSPKDKELHAARARINQLRAESESSLMAKGLFGQAADASQRRAEG